MVQYGPICINDSGEPGGLAARPGDSEPTAPGISAGEPYAGHFRREPGAKVPNMGGRRVAAATFHAFYVRYSTILDLDLSTIHMLFLFFWRCPKRKQTSTGLIHHGAWFIMDMFHTFSFFMETKSDKFTFWLANVACSDMRFCIFLASFPGEKLPNNEQRLWSSNQGSPFAWKGRTTNKWVVRKFGSTSLSAPEIKLTNVNQLSTKLCKTKGTFWLPFGNLINSLRTDPWLYNLVPVVAMLDCQGIHPY